MKYRVCYFQLVNGNVRHHEEDFVFGFMARLYASLVSRDSGIFGVRIFRW